MEILALLLIIPMMFIVGVIVFGWAIWDDYKSGHTRHREKFFGDD